MNLFTSSVGRSVARRSREVPTPTQSRSSDSNCVTVWEIELINGRWKQISCPLIIVFSLLNLRFTIYWHARLTWSTIGLRQNFGRSCVVVAVCLQVCAALRWPCVSVMPTLGGSEQCVTMSVVVVCLSVRCSQMTVCEKMKMRLGWAGFGWPNLALAF